MRLFTPATLALLAWCATAPTSAQSTADRPRLVSCPPVLEFYLPGDYYFCVGGHRQIDGHSKRALDYFERAAAWGHKNAQYLLGLMHFQGDGTPVDRPLGLAWLTLAAERDDPSMNAALAFAQRHVSRVERERAERLLATMRLTYADAVTVERAATRYERETRDLRRSLAFDPFSAVYIAGLGSGSASSMLRRMDQRADRFFEGVRSGEVTVGALDVVDESRATKPGNDSTEDGEP